MSPRCLPSPCQCWCNRARKRVSAISSAEIKGNRTERQHLWPRTTPQSTIGHSHLSYHSSFPWIRYRSTHTYTACANTLALVTHSHYISHQITLGSSHCHLVGNSACITNYYFFMHSWPSLSILISVCDTTAYLIDTPPTHHLFILQWPAYYWPRVT